MALDMSSIVSDPDFQSPYVIVRNTGVWVRGAFPKNTTRINASGVVAGVSEEEALQVPEGDRVKGLKKFYATVPLYGPRKDGTPDLRYKDNKAATTTTTTKK